MIKDKRKEEEKISVARKQKRKNRKTPPSNKKNIC
jgi:hypothetical protein